MAGSYDRSAEDIGNIVALEHANLGVADQGTATLFYMSGLGLTRDPYMMTSIDNMWVNVGRGSQFHLPTMKQGQKLRGRIGLVIPDREGLLTRLGNMKKLLAGTQFDFVAHEDHVATTCPWGNNILCYEPSKKFAGMVLGMAYIEFDVPTGAAAGIASFYRDVFGSKARVDGAAAHVPAGHGQELVFRETDRTLAPYDGHHIQIYVADFSGPHKHLLARKLVTEESNQYQYRFTSIDGLFDIEHEVRSLTHPLYARPLVNRNPRQTNRNYIPGRDGFVPEVEYTQMDDPRVALRRERFEEARRAAE